MNKIALGAVLTLACFGAIYSPASALPNMGVSLIPNVSDTNEIQTAISDAGLVADSSGAISSDIAQQEVAPTTAPAPIPEPVNILLFGGSLMVVAGAARKIFFKLHVNQFKNCH